MFEKFGFTPRQEKIEKDSQIDGSQEKKINADIYREAKFFLESHNWEEYLNDLGSKRDRIVRSYPVSEEQKKEHPKEVDEFNIEIKNKIKSVEKSISEISSIEKKSSAFMKLIDELENLRNNLENIYIGDEAERDKYFKKRAA